MMQHSTRYSMENGFFEDSQVDPRVKILEREKDKGKVVLSRSSYSGISWTQLDLSATGLRTLSPEIRHYSHLTALYLNNNKLSSLPEEFFGELRSLVTLDLSSNNLSRIPSSISLLSHLSQLLLQNNRLATLPMELGQLHGLKELNVVGNPLIMPPISVVQRGTEKVLAFLRECVPMEPPPKRKFISYLEPSQAIGLSERNKFKVFSYNILAESYTSEDRYYYCPSWALDWSYRKQGILKEMLTYDADILCLQEVEAGQYTSFFQPEMAKMNYSGIFVPKSRARTMEDWSSVDGCVIFYKENRFTLVEEHVIEFQSIAMAKHKELSGDPEAFSRVITKDNVGLAVILQLKEPNSNGRWANPKHVLVCNTHIHWNPEHCDVKLMQVCLLLEQLASITSNKSKWHKLPMVVCGDFNSGVGSGPYDLLTKGSLPAGHTDLQSYNYGVYSMQGMQHPLQLGSAYAPIGEPPFTNYTNDFVGVLDYLWYSYGTLAVSKVLQPVDEDTVRSTRLPNAYMPSDHISILSEFFFK